MEALLEPIYRLSLQDFFAWIKSIRYGYKDQAGALHFAEDADFLAEPYAFSAPWEVAENRCGWCWDVCQLIKHYCIHNGYPYKTWYFEYRDPERGIHITHTQCFLSKGGVWYLCPDNADPSDFGAQCSRSFEELIGGIKESYARAAEIYYQGIRPERYLVKEYDLDFPSGLPDEELMERIRAFCAL